MCDENQDIHYPSAEMLLQVCYNDYQRLIDTYDKIYEKVNVTLAFCGIILLFIINSLNFTYVADILKTQSTSEFVILIMLLFCSAASTVCIVLAVIQLLLLMRSKTIYVFDSIDIRNDKIYRWNHDAAALWVIDKYTEVIAGTEEIAGLRNIINEKQKKYNSTIIKVLVAFILYSIVLILEKVK